MKILRNNELFRSACFFAGLMCLLSLLPFPMLSFATVVRYVTFAVAAWGIAIAVCQKSTLTVLKLIAAAVLLNPVAPLVMDVGVMKVCTVAAAIVFFAAGVRLRAESLPASLTPAGEERAESAGD